MRLQGSPRGGRCVRRRTTPPPRPGLAPPEPPPLHLRPLLDGAEGRLLPAKVLHERVRPLHLLEDLVLAAPDLPLHRLDLVEHRRVLLVGLHLHELAPVLRALDLEILHHRLVLAAALLRGFERGADILETAAVARQAGFELLAETGNLAKLGLRAPELGPRTGAGG